MNNKDIITKIKEKAYENVNKKIEEEKKETERKIKKILEKYQTIEIVEESEKTKC